MRLSDSTRRARSWRSRLGSGATLTWTSVLALIVFSILMVVVANPALLAGGLVLPLSASLASLPILFATLAAARYLLGPSGLAGHPARVIAVYVVASTLRSIANAALLVAWDVIDSTGLVARVLLAVPSFTAALIVVDLSWGAVREHRRAMQELVEREEEARAARDEALSRLAMDREFARARVRDEVTEICDRFDTSDPQDLVVSLRHAVEDVVRPLSHGMRAQAPESMELPPIPASRRGWRSVVDDATRTQPLRPTAVAASLFVIGVVYVFVAMPVRDATIEITLAFAGTWILLRLASALTESWWRRAGLPARIVVMTSVLIGIGVVLAVVSLLLLGRSDVTDRLAFAYVSLIPILGWGFALSRAAERQRHDLETAQRLRVDRMDWQAARASAASWKEQQDIALALHGPIQGALGAAAIRLSQAMRVGEVDDALLHELRHELMSALGSLEVPAGDGGAGPDLSTALDDVAQTWRGICTITWSVDPESDRRLVEDPMCARLAVDVASEACWNAIRHGQATSVVVDVPRPEAPNALTVTVTDDGHGPDPAAMPGYGTHMLDQVSIRWSRLRLENRTRLTVTLPFQGRVESDYVAAP